MASGSLPQSPSPRPSTTSTTINTTLQDRTYTGVGNLIKLLPTGTTFMYYFLSPLFTNYGHCYIVNKYLTGALLFLCGLSCCLSCFTDSYKGSVDGRVHYGLATLNGLWAFGDPNAGSEDLSAYKLRAGDFVHAFLSVVVFVVLGLMDTNTANCYYPSLRNEQAPLLMSLPTAAGALASVVFMVYPNTRHGIGTNEYRTGKNTLEDLIHASPLPDYEAGLGP